MPSGSVSDRVEMDVPSSAFRLAMKKLVYLKNISMPRLPTMLYKRKNSRARLECANFSMPRPAV